MSFSDPYKVSHKYRLPCSCYQHCQSYLTKLPSLPHYVRLSPSSFWGEKSRKRVLYYKGTQSSDSSIYFCRVISQFSIPQEWKVPPFLSFLQILRGIIKVSYPPVLICFSIAFICSTNDRASTRPILIIMSQLDPN